MASDSGNVRANVIPWEIIKGEGKGKRGTHGWAKTSMSMGLAIEAQGKVVQDPETQPSSGVEQGAHGIWEAARCGGF